MMSRFTITYCVLQALTVAACMTTVSANDDVLVTAIVKRVKGKKLCEKGWECKGLSIYCCNQTISDFFKPYHFDNLFANRNSPVSHAVGFWDYRSFIKASAAYQPRGFGTTGGNISAMKEVAAFLAHVGSKTSCGYDKAAGGKLAWGLYYNKEMSPSKLYCDDYYKYTYPCSPGASYHGRGALPLYWNYNYGKAGEALKMDLLNHPEYIEQNATLAFQAAIWQWMNPPKKNQPSAHQVFVGTWKPTENDTLAKRVSSFGTAMNVLYGDQVCGLGNNEDMNNIISHYQYYLDLMGVGRDKAGDYELLSCAEQKAFNPLSNS